VGTCALRKGARKKADPRDASRPGRYWIGCEARVTSEGDYEGRWKKSKMARQVMVRQIAKRISSMEVEATTRLQVHRVVGRQRAWHQAALFRAGDSPIWQFPSTLRNGLLF